LASAKSFAIVQELRAPIDRFGTSIARPAIRTRVVVDAESGSIDTSGKVFQCLRERSDQYLQSIFLGGFPFSLID
jgi:hypothetical protein